MGMLIYVFYLEMLPQHLQLITTLKKKQHKKPVIFYRHGCKWMMKHIVFVSPKRKSTTWRKRNRLIAEKTMSFVPNIPIVPYPLNKLYERMKRTTEEETILLSTIKKM